MADLTPKAVRNYVERRLEGLDQDAYDVRTTYEEVLRWMDDHPRFSGQDLQDHLNEEIGWLIGCAQVEKRSLGRIGRSTRRIVNNSKSTLYQLLYYYKLERVRA